ncbi:MAG TPA: hypothetical protein VEA58_05390 [Anaerovoracaceae bacterium]|nr:hypothetical protein [Anaerovoracaceae bacterium]
MKALRVYHWILNCLGNAFCIILIAIAVHNEGVSWIASILFTILIVVGGTLCFLILPMCFQVFTSMVKYLSVICLPIYFLDQLSYYLEGIYILNLSAPDRGVFNQSATMIIMSALTVFGALNIYSALKVRKSGFETDMIIPGAIR